MLKAMKTITYGYKGFDLALNDLCESVRKCSGRANLGVAEGIYTPITGPLRRPSLLSACNF